ncbi:MAG: protein-export chaperone SecB [Methylococcaceae bacterium]|nr:MAG: protein-export chaperone SecB [Methylococcaceae bacterium]
MSENTGEQEKQFAIQKLYIKDVSFESPNSPQVFTEHWEPQVNLNLNSAVQSLQNGHYEVALTVTATVKQGDNTAYLVEVCQAGIFTLVNFPEPELGRMLGTYCLNVIYPYAREVVSDLVIKGGFPPLLLAPVNFDLLYAKHQAQQAGGIDAAPPSNTIN